MYKRCFSSEIRFCARSSTSNRACFSAGETGSGSDKTEVDRVQTTFLIKKLGLADGPALDEAIAKVLADYGSANRNKYRAVIYYMLTKHFGKEAAYA